MKHNFKRKLLLFSAICAAIILPMAGLVTGAVFSFGIEVGLAGGAAIGCALYILMMRKVLHFTKWMWLFPILVLIICLGYSLLFRGGGWGISIMLACFSLVLFTAPQAICRSEAAAVSQSQEPMESGTAPEDDGRMEAAPSVPRKLSLKLKIVTIGIFAAMVIFVVIGYLNPPPAAKPEDMADLYQQVNPTFSMDGVTFPIEPDWAAVDGTEGAFRNKDGTEVFSLNGISPLGSYTPKEIYQGLYDRYSKTYKVTNNPVLAGYTTGDGVSCQAGDIEMIMDQDTYAFVTVIIAPQKNMVISFMGQRRIGDTKTQVPSVVKKMMFGLTFQVADHDVVSGSTFVAQGDGSELCLKENGSFYYYAAAGDHSQKYYTGTYECFRGQEAFDKIASMTQYGLTAKELEQTNAANMDGYIPGGSSPGDFLHALEPSGKDNRPRYQVCTDSFYALILHNDKVVMSKNDIQKAGNTVLYLGYYIPELKLLDLLNANTANQYGMKLTGSTAKMDVEPTD